MKSPSTAPLASPLPRLAIGIMVYNEERNLGRLLASLLEAHPRNCLIGRVVVVSSGSIDRSVEIAREWQARDPRVIPIEEPKRRGKAAAINLFLASVVEGFELCALISADVLPAHDAIEHLVAPFSDPEVGMSGAHPVPTNEADSLIGQIVHLQWDLHDEIARKRPKLGEAIAFRNVIPHIAPETAVDEAFLEALFTQKKMRTAYAAEALVYNRGPSGAIELIRQRRRIWAGHLWLRRQTGYEVSTFRPLAVLRAAGARLRHEPRLAGTMAVAAGIELCSRLLGSWDVLVRGMNPTIWKVSPSTKAVEAPSDLKAGVKAVEN
jgi:glycosyltransferase involved in cell wall biosynthesis